MECAPNPVRFHVCRSHYGVLPWARKSDLGTEIHQQLPDCQALHCTSAASTGSTDDSEWGAQGLGVGPLSGASLRMGMGKTSPIKQGKQEQARAISTSSSLMYDGMHAPF